MKTPLFWWLALALSLLGPAGHAQHPAATPPRPRNVAFVVYPGVEALDLSGPLDVLLKANRLTNNAYRCYTVALTDSVLATEQGGLRLRPDYTFQTMPAPDVLVVPGTSPARLRQLLAEPAGLVAQLRSRAPRVPLVLSVCTGALLLAQAGVLDGHRATTHWAMTDSLARQFPRVQVVRGVRFVADGRVLTTAGVTAGLDGALHVVEQYSGRAVADAVARALEYTRPPTALMPAMPAPPVLATAPAQSQSSGIALANVADPVCHMAIKPITAHRHVYKGKTYGFCSGSCQRIFTEKPAQYVP